MTATARTKSTRTPVFIGGGLVVALLVVALIAGDNGSGQGGPIFSPVSTAGDGTRGLVLLLRDLGADVRVGERVPDASTHVALLLHDRLDETSTDQLAQWVQSGNTLVVADPFSSFAAPASGRVVDHVTAGDCDIAELSDVRQLEVGPLFTEQLDVSAAAAYEVDANRSCFGDGRRAFVVRAPSGQGTIVSIGNAGVFANSVLDHADNSVLAARLLLPGVGGSVAVLDPNPPGSGATGLSDLIADRVFQAILQLGVAFLLYAVWRSRRLGRPVTEPQPVAVAGSQFVRAVGGLRQRSRATDAAATTLRTDTRRLLCERFNVESTLNPVTLAELTSARTGLDRDRVIAALGSTPILDEAALVSLGQQLDTIRQEVLDGRSR